MHGPFYADAKLKRVLNAVRFSYLILFIVCLLFELVAVLRLAGIHALTGANAKTVAPSMILAVSAAGMLLFGYSFYAQGRLLARLSRVSLTVSETGVEGVSLPNPASGDAAYPNGQSFSLTPDQIASVGIRHQFYWPRTSSLRLELVSMDGAVYSLPSIERIHDAHRIIETLAGNGADKTA